MSFLILLLLHLHLNYLLSVAWREKALLTNLIFSLIHTFWNRGHFNLA